MDSSRVQQRAAETILERGVRFKIPAPFYLRMLGIKTTNLVVKRPKYGTLLAMSKVSAEMNADINAISEGSLNEAFALVEKHGEAAMRWIAIAVLNSKMGIELNTNKLTQRLMWRLSTKQFSELFLLVITLSGVQDFTSIIRFINTLNLTETRAENLSQNEEGS